MVANISRKKYFYLKTMEKKNILSNSILNIIFIILFKI